MEKLLVVSCVSDDIKAPISMYLMNNKRDAVTAAVDKYAANIGAEVLYLLPEGEKPEGLDANVAYCAPNPTLSNPYAIQQVLEGFLPRPMIQDDFKAVYDGKEISVITPEAAYGISNGFATKWIVINKGDKSEIKEAASGSKLGDVADLAGAKAVLVGGLKGDFMTPAAAADLVLNMSSDFGSATIYGPEECIVKVCAGLYEETWKNSCGKCVLCREGTSQFRQIIAEMTTGKSKSGDLTLVKEVGELIRLGAYCPFGQNMPRPIMTAMELFAGEFEEHVKKKACPCGICYKAKVSYYIDPDTCTGCGDCLDACPEEAIEGKDGYIHMIDQDLCEKCGKCVSACDENAILSTAGKLPKLPKKRTKVGRW